MELFQLAEFARLATPLARFGTVGRAASKRTVARAAVTLAHVSPHPTSPLMLWFLKVFLA